MFFKLPSLFLKISLFKSCRFPILNISQMCFSITLLEAITTFLSLLLFLPNSFKADTLQWLRSPLSLWPRITMPGLLLNSHAVPLSPSFSFLRVPNSFLPYCFFICLYFLSEGNTLYIWLTCFYFGSQKKNFFLAPLSSMQDLSFLNRDQTQAPCNGSTESQPLNHKGSPFRFQFKFSFWRYTFSDLSNLCKILAVTSDSHLYISHK